MPAEGHALRSWNQVIFVSWNALKQAHNRPPSLEELPVLQRSSTEWVWGTRRTMTMVSRATCRR